VSILLIIGFYAILVWLTPERALENRRHTIRAVASIFLIFNVLYFTNAIPPLPLALKSAGVYHNVARVGDTYALTYEPLPWYREYLNYNTIFHHSPGTPVYVWSSIFAPSGLSTTIYHEWQRYDDAMQQWVTTNEFSYPITGGRDGGYRGYSMKIDVTSGEWRVRVVTRYGQVIGQVAFSVQDVSTPAPTDIKTE